MRAAVIADQPFKRSISVQSKGVRNSFHRRVASGSDGTTIYENDKGRYQPSARRVVVKVKRSAGSTWKAYSSSLRPEPK